MKNYETLHKLLYFSYKLIWLKNIYLKIYVKVDTVNSKLKCEKVKIKSNIIQREKKSKIKKLTLKRWCEMRKWEEFVEATKLRAGITHFSVFIHHHRRHRRRRTLRRWRRSLILSISPLLTRFLNALRFICSFRIPAGISNRRPKTRRTGDDIQQSFNVTRRALFVVVLCKRNNQKLWG